VTYPKMLVAFAALSLVVAGFAAGRLSAPGALASILGATPGQPRAQLVQQGDPRELIPLNPQPGQGQGPGQGQPPGQGQQPQECPVYIYQDGQLYQFPAPGQQPGQQPGQGSGPGPGGPGDQELLPLHPNIPSIPGLPSTPSLPGQPAEPSVPGTRS